MIELLGGRDLGRFLHRRFLADDRMAKLAILA
jgi:hypothetical protein